MSLLADNIMLVHLIRYAQQIKLLTDRGDSLEFCASKDFSGRVRRATRDDGFQRKLLTILPFTATRAQLVAVELQVLASQRQNIGTAAQLVEYFAVVRVVRLKNHCGRVL